MIIQLGRERLYGHIAFFFFFFFLFTEQAANIKLRTEANFGTGFILPNTSGHQGRREQLSILFAVRETPINNMDCVPTGTKGVLTRSQYVLRKDDAAGYITEAVARTHSLNCLTYVP